MNGVLYVPHILYNEKEHFKVLEVEEGMGADLGITTTYKKGDDSYVATTSKEVEEFYERERKAEQVRWADKIFKYDGYIPKNSMLESLVYFPCVVNLYTTNGRPESMDNFIFYFRSGDPFGLVIEFDPVNIALESEVELKMWMNQSMAIYKTTEKYTFTNDVMRRMAASLPARTFKLHLNKDGNCYLKDCKIAEKLAENKYSVAVNSIEFYVK